MWHATNVPARLKPGTVCLCGMRTNYKATSACFGAATVVVLKMSSAEVNPNIKEMMRGRNRRCAACSWLRK